MIQSLKKQWADKLGAISAFLCIIHCLAVPTLLAMGIGFISNPIIAYLFIFIAFFSILSATKHKLFSGISLFLWVAFIGFVASLLLEDYAEIFEYLMFFFSGAIILGHVYNLKFCST